MLITRTDKWTIEARSESDFQAMCVTSSIYRDYVRFLMHIANTHWPQIGGLKGKQRLTALEKLFHPTKANPSPRYARFFQRAGFYKFPSYLRRAAINAAIGQVSSFHTRYRDWVCGQSRVRREARPPGFQSACSVNPVLYANQCYRNLTAHSVEIKVFKANDWQWIQVRILSQGVRHLLVNSEMESPSLIIRGNAAQLSVPFKLNVPRLEDSERVCGVDLGINTTAVCSVIDSLGEVHARAFIHNGRAIDKRDKHLARIRRKASATMGKGGSLHRGFGRVHYRKAAQINTNMARQVARKILNVAVQNGATTIVFENLKGWNPRGGRKRSTLRQRFHGWLKAAILKQVEQIAQEVGIKVVTVYARGTSSLAYDGSGELKRDSKHHELATFKSGKRYCCDLSASYNIAARWVAITLKLARKNGQLLSGKRSSSKPRSRVTLSTLWSVSQTDPSADRDDTPTTALSA